MGYVAPFSSAILDEIDRYRTVLESYSERLLPLIRWQPTSSGNVEVLNDTADFYRYFDATPHAEFLYECIKRTIEEDLPQEADYLIRFDAAQAAVMNRVEMPDRLVQNLILFVRQNRGTLAKKRREKEFKALTDVEVTNLEAIINEAFEGLD